MNLHLKLLSSQHWYLGTEVPRPVKVEDIAPIGSKGRKTETVNLQGYLSGMHLRLLRGTKKI